MLVGHTLPANARRTATAAVLVLAGALAVVSSAWGFQLIGGYVPCKLCLEQRVPYYVGMPLAAFAAVAAIALPGRLVLARVLLAAFAIAMIYGGGIGVYQAGAEWGFWPGPVDCGGGTELQRDAGGLLNALETIRVVSCTEASWRRLGLSFAGWNVVASAVLAALAIWGALSRRHG